VLSKSLFVGDAAGRPETASRKKDFADTDYKLALNVGVAFKTPECFFLGSKDELHCAPSTAGMFSVASLAGATETNPELFSELLDSPEIVLLVAPAASGKSTLAKKFVSHVRVNRDTLGTKEKCEAAAAAALDAGRSVVVDNTNTTIEARKDWLTFAQKRGLPIRAVYLSSSKELCKHLRVFRMLSPMTEEADRRFIEDMVINMHFKNLVAPQRTEGFDRIDAIEFSPAAFDDADSQRLFQQFLY